MSSSGDSRSFQEKIVDILNYGALNLAMGMGYRAGLFDSLDAAGEALTIEEICLSTGLARPYVREWLNVMVCGGIVELVPGQNGEDRFGLPAAHGDLLAARSGSDNLGVYTQEIPLLTVCAMQQVYRGFQTGEGVDYSHYPEFHDFMAQLSDAKHRRVLVDTFLPSVDAGRLVRDLRRGIDVCDLGCAQGVATLLMAEAFPASRFTGIDISREALDVARGQAHAKGLTNVHFKWQDAAQLRHADDMGAAFDYITAFDAIHDQTRPMEVLRGVHHILKAEGAFSMIDIAAESDVAGNRDHPMGPFLYTVSLMHCMPVGLVDGGAGLGMMWGRQLAEKMLAQAGFSRIAVTAIPNDPFNDHFFCRK